MKQHPPDWQIEFFIDNRGKNPVADFLDKLPIAERAKITKHIHLLKEFGTRLGMPQARPLKGHKPLWELRPMPNRLIYVALTGKRFVLLHGFKKKSQKTPQNEINVAEKRFQKLQEKEG